MTWSIIAKDAATGRVGIAVATCTLAVGARVPHIRTGAGAIASQAYVNPYYGPRGLDLLSRGLDARAVIEQLTAADEGRDHRQLHMMDRADRFAAWTGAACVPWCGHEVRAGFSVAGNMLAGSAVLTETIRAYEAGSDLPFARRLVRAMQAGDAAGGDKRGRQSAALLIHDDEDYAFLDLRVDDHTAPLVELARLEQVSRTRAIHLRRLMPSASDPAGLMHQVDIDAHVARSIADGYE